MIQTASVVNTRRFVTVLSSPLKGVNNAAWSRFVTALEVQGVRDVSESGGLGAYAIPPRRLIELGYAVKQPSVRTPKGRQVHSCKFISPWTKEQFLADPVAQYVVLSKSMMLYDAALEAGELHRPADISFSGLLAVLHCGGRGALAAWPKLFDNTQALYDKVKGIF